MSTINENPRISDVLLFEEGEEFNLVRDAITIASGTAASAVGQVLGKITIGAATAAAKSGGNTGTGTLTMDPTTPVLANADVGVYTVRCVVATTDKGTFEVKGPLGNSLGTVISALTGGTVFSDRIKFTIVTITSHDYVLGDGFDITVAAGSGKYTQVAPAATDGSQNAAAVLIGGASAATYGADTAGVAVVRPPAIFKLNGLAWTSGMSAGQKTTALAQLAALGMPTRTDYGV